MKRNGFDDLDDDTQKEALAATFAYHTALEIAAEDIRQRKIEGSPAYIETLMMAVAEHNIENAALELDMSDDPQEWIFADTLRAGLRL
jgi:hypothetical protein